MQIEVGNFPSILSPNGIPVASSLAGEADAEGNHASFGSLLLGCLAAEVKQAVACGEKVAANFSKQEEETEAAACELIDEFLVQLAGQQDAEGNHTSFGNLLLGCFEAEVKQAVACGEEGAEKTESAAGEAINKPFVQFVKGVVGEILNFLPQVDAETLSCLLSGEMPSGKYLETTAATAEFPAGKEPFLTDNMQGITNKETASEVLQLLLQDPQITGKESAEATFSEKAEADNNSVKQKRLLFYDQSLGDKTKVLNDSNKIGARVFRELDYPDKAVAEASSSPERPNFETRLEQDNCSAEEEPSKYCLEEAVNRSEDVFSLDSLNAHSALYISEAESPNKLGNTVPIRQSLLGEEFAEVLKQNIVKEIVNEINLEKDSSLIKLKLYPEALGKLELLVSVEKGLLQARFLADSHNVAQLLESRLPELKDCLQENGSHWQEVNLTVDCRSGEEGSSRDASNYRRSYEGLEVSNYSGVDVSPDSYLQEEERNHWEKTALVDYFI